MARKFKTNLISLVMVDDTGELRRNDQLVQRWSITKSLAEFDGVQFDPWQHVFVDQMGECEATDTRGGKHKFFRSVKDKDDVLRPLQRSDVREGRL
jgi:hypothetical protein